MMTVITVYIRGRSSTGKGQWCIRKELIFNLSPKNKLVKQNRESRREKIERKGAVGRMNSLCKILWQKEHGMFYLWKEALNRDRIGSWPHSMLPLLWFSGHAGFPKVPKKLPRASQERKTDACLLIFFLPKLAQGIQHRGHRAHPLNLQQVLGFTYFSLQQW